MANLSANISGKEHDRDNKDTAWETTKSPYIVSRFYELWSTNGEK